MTESAYFESLGVFFNDRDANIFVELLRQRGLPVKVDILTSEHDPDEIIGVEIFTKKSAVEPALQIKKELIEKTLENTDFYLHQISEDELLKIPYHPEDANDFDYWAALELIKRKGLALENKDWEAYRQEKLLELFEQKIPKTSGLFYAGMAVLILGAAMLALTYQSLPAINVLFFAGSLLIGKKMAGGGDFIAPAEQRKGRLLMYLSAFFMVLSLYFTYRQFSY